MPAAPASASSSEMRARNASRPGFAPMASSASVLGSSDAQAEVANDARNGRSRSLEKLRITGARHHTGVVLFVTIGSRPGQTSRLMSVSRRVRGRGTGSRPSPGKRCRPGGVRSASVHPRAVRTGRKSDQERWVPEVEGRIQTRRWARVAESIRPDADLAEIEACQHRRGSKSRAGTEDRSRCRSSQDGAATLLTGLAGAIR